MAAKKTPTAKAKPARTASTQARKTATPAADPTPQDLSDAKTLATSLLAKLAHAKRELESARTINTTDHRLIAVALKLEKVTALRNESMEANDRVAVLKNALNSRPYNVGDRTRG